MKKAFLVAILLILIINFSFAASVTQKITDSDSNATRAIVLYNLAISQLNSGDYVDAFNNLKEARELLPTISSVVDGFQKTFDSAKFFYTKQMIKINKLSEFSSTVTKPEKKINKDHKPIFIYGLLGFLLFFTLTYAVLYIYEIKKSLISGFFVSFIVSLASKYGYTVKSDYEEELNDEDTGESLEIEEVSQEEMGKIEQSVKPEDVEDENVEEILSQLLGINEDAPTTEEEIELEEEEEEKEEEEERELSEKGKKESSNNLPGEDEKELSSETSKATSRVLSIEDIKDPRNEMMLTIERLKEEMYQIMVALKEKEIKDQDDLDNALKIMYVYSVMTENVNSDSSNTGGSDAE
jgi:hypothetical protein